MKKILFLNTTKLAVLSAMLLLAVFCTIGMSFTPAEEGENVGNPNDSTYVTGPRRSHWTTTTTSCGNTTITYHNDTDYARVNAVVKIYDGTNAEISSPNIGQVTLENISTSTETGTVKDSLLLGNETTSAYINWNSSAGTNSDGKPVGDTIIAAAHKLKVKFTAECIHDDYNFVGWYKAEGMSDSDFKEGAASFSEVICIGGGNEPGTGYGSYAKGEANKKTTYTTGARDTVTYYACFQPKANVTVTLKAAENGTYTYTDGTNSGTITSTDGSIETKSVVTLQASPATGYKFFGWYKMKDGKETYFSYKSSTEKTFPTDAAIYAKFIPKDWATYIVINNPDVQYYDFQAAANAASSATEKVFLPLVSGVVPADDYTIPSNVTLLIPYDNAYTANMSSPTTVTADASPKDPSLYRKLTLENEVNIKVQGGGSICVNAKILSGNTTAKNVCGRVTGGYGLIDMMSGSSITLSSGAYLYCWGYIIGEGTVEAESGANVYEPFQLADFRGGNASTSFLTPNSCHKIFPYSQYYVQNIEVPLTLQAGAKETLFSGFIVTKPLTKEIIETTFSPKFVGSDGLFDITEGTFTKYYDKDEDRLVCTVNGNLEMKKIEISITNPITSGTNKISSENYVLPITNNLTININSGTTTVNAEAALLAGTRTYIAKGATLQLTKTTYVYDSLNWASGQYVYGGSGKQLYFKPLHYSGSGGTSIKTKRTDENLLDAVIDVNGTLKVENYLYTTGTGTGTEPNLGGADICSSEGTGIIQLTNGAGTETKTYQATQSGSDIAYSDIPITPAQLHNGEEWYKDKDDKFKKEYLATAGVSASTTIQYANNHWGWMEIWKDHDGTILNINNTCTQTNNSSAYEHNVLPEGYTFIGWNTEVNNINQEVIHTAQYTFGPELDIVDADNTKKTLTINATSFALSGWSYTINDVEYARPADRMLTIPYGDKDPDEEIVIEVKDKEGTVVSCNMYIVPFVYTSDATLSGTDENSIVFVKSGTLSIEGTASAKEIYVAPGAELKVTGTLTVGKLVLRTTPFDAAILTNKGTIAGQVYYSRIARDADFHLFAIPAGSNTANVVLSDGSSCAVNSTTTPYGAAWQLREYNTARRAAEGATGANWDNIGVNADKTTYSDVAIEASKGYELRSGSKYYREYLFPITLPTTATEVVVVSATGAAGAAHTGWNILCSPYTGIYTVENYNDPATAIKVCWQQTDGSYIQEQPKQIKPAVPFAYQTMENGSLDFSASSFIFKAPRKQSAAEALTETEWVHLDIFDAYGEGDETSLFVHPTRFEQTYKTGIDMAKQSLTASRAILYTTHAYGDMAFAGVADSLLENGIDLIVYSPSAQELTFSLRENKFLNRLEYLWLADNETGARTDLLMNDYTFRADAGTAKGRFVLNGRFKAPQISTGIGNTQTDYNIYAIGNNIAISGVEQGTPIYVFDAVGHMIYTTAATSDEVIVPAPCAGVYMLTIGGQTAKLVINQ